MSAVGGNGERFAFRGPFDCERGKADAFSPRLSEKSDDSRRTARKKNTERQER